MMIRPSEHYSVCPPDYTATNNKNSQDHHDSSTMILRNHDANMKEYHRTSTGEDSNQSIESFYSSFYPSIEDEEDSISIEVLIEKFEAVMNTLGLCSWYYSRDSPQQDEQELRGLSFVEEECPPQDLIGLSFIEYHDD